MILLIRTDFGDKGFKILRCNVFHGLLDCKELTDTYKSSILHAVLPVFGLWLKHTVLTRQNKDFLSMQPCLT